MHAHTTHLKQSTTNVQPGMDALNPNSLLMILLVKKLKSNNKDSCNF